MLKSKAFFLVLLFWTALLGEAKAKSLFFEPYVGVGKLEGQFQNSSGTYTFKDFANGFYLGGKLGVYFGRQLFVGGDYHIAGPYTLTEVHSLHGSSDDKNEWSQTMKGLGIGIDYKIIRFWAGYYFDNVIEDVTADIKYTGTAMKAGFGLMASRNLRCNLSVVWHQMNEHDLSYSSIDAKEQNIISTHVSISLPIHF